MSETSRSAWIFNIALLVAALTAAYAIVTLSVENRELRARLQAADGSPLEVSYAAGDELPPVPVVPVALAAGAESAELSALYEDGGVVVFLTTTCPYCLETLPSWASLARDLGAAGVPFHGVSFHSADLTEEYVREHDIDWPVWVLPDASVASQVRVASVPFTVLVGPGAVVRQVWLGTLQPEDLRQLRDATLATAAP